MPLNPYFQDPTHQLNTATDELWDAKFPGIYIRHSAQYQDNNDWVVKVKDALTKLSENAIGRMLLEAIKQTDFPNGQSAVTPTNFKVIIEESPSAANPQLNTYFNNMKAAYENAVAPGNALMGGLVRGKANTKAMGVEVKAKAQALVDAFVPYYMQGNINSILAAHRAEKDFTFNSLTTGAMQNGKMVPKPATYSELKAAGDNVSGLLKNLIPSIWAERVETHGSPVTEAATEMKPNGQMGPIRAFAGPTIVKWFPSDAVYDVRGDVPSIVGGGRILLDTPFGKTEVNGARPPWISLGHELIHALHFIEGTGFTTPNGVNPDLTLADTCRIEFGGGVDRVIEEWRTVGIRGTVDPQRMVAGANGNQPCVNANAKTPQEKYANCAITENNMRAVAGIAPRVGYKMLTAVDGTATACRLDADDQALPYSAAEAADLDFGPAAAEAEGEEGPLADGAFDAPACEAAEGHACPCCAAAALL